jgi:archaellum component FlaF (FlaF/FlaG flagellin family)
MMMVVIISMLVVVAVLYFAWDEISAATAAKKELNEAYWDERP